MQLTWGPTNLIGTVNLDVPGRRENGTQPKTNCTAQRGFSRMENSKAQGAFRVTKFTVYSAPLLAPGTSRPPAGTPRLSDHSPAAVTTVSLHLVLASAHRDWPSPGVTQPTRPYCALHPTRASRGPEETPEKLLQKFFLPT